MQPQQFANCILVVLSCTVLSLANHSNRNRDVVKVIKRPLLSITLVYKAI